MSAFRPGRRPTLAGRELLFFLRGAGTWDGSVAELARRVGGRERATWYAIVGLMSRGLVTATSTDAGVRVTLTREGRRIRL